MTESLIDATLWYLTMTVLGWLALPLTYRMLLGLPDRGLALARTLGLLVWGYLFWMLATLGILRNDPGGILLALLLLAALSAVALRGHTGEFFGWLRDRRGLVLGVEALFLAAFLLILVVRAANPEILGTEKPMELAFINAILHSPNFPPHDPWLAGYAISYYYFGYILVAMLAMLTGTPGGVAFNLGISLVFALSALGVYSLVFNLLAARSSGSDEQTHRFSPGALFGPVFILLVSNVVGFLEVLHARGYFWGRDAAGQPVSIFWKWLDLRELSQAPAEPYSWLPTRYLWWWRASRVVQDYDYAYNWKEVIDEFPVFSFILSDLHPHVLAMPFAFLAMAVALNLFLGGAQGVLSGLRRQVNVRTLAWGAVVILLAGLVMVWTGALAMDLRNIFGGSALLLVGASIFILMPDAVRRHGLKMLTNPDLGVLEMGRTFGLNLAGFLFAAVVLGATGFLNIWDFPFFVVLFAAAYALRRQRTESAGLSRLLGDFLGLTVALGLAGLLAYLPFYLGFSSQAGGILPNLVYPTRGVHLWVMFAPLLLPVLAFLWFWGRSKTPGLAVTTRKLLNGLLIAAGMFLVLWVLSLLLGVVIARLPGGVGDIFMSSLAAPGLAELLAESMARRVASTGGWVTLVLLVGVVVGLLISYQYNGGNPTTEDPRSPASLPAELFALLLVLLGAMLVLGPEFFYLRDLFGWRINTIFKFYYLAWHLWGIAAAFSAALLLGELRGVRGALFTLGLSTLLIVSLTYTILGVWNKTNGFKPANGWTLDGTAYMELEQPDEMAAVHWLSEAPPGVVAEAVGGSYSVYARISALSGQPTVLGWDFHEMQWRGGSEEIGSRPRDIQRLYCTRDTVEAREIIEQYDIRYVFIGNLERITYTADICPGGVNEAKFMRFLSPVFQQGTAVIYAVP